MIKVPDAISVQIIIIHIHALHILHVYFFLYMRGFKDINVQSEKCKWDCNDLWNGSGILTVLVFCSVNTVRIRSDFYDVKKA